MFYMSWDSRSGEDPHELKQGDDGEEKSDGYAQKDDENLVK